MDDDRYEMVVCTIVEDALCTAYGIKGPLTDDQKNILLSAANKHVDKPEVLAAWTMVVGDIDYFLENEEELSESNKFSIGQIKASMLKSGQVVELVKGEWPTYPVLTSTFMTWC